MVGRSSKSLPDLPKAFHLSGYLVVPNLVPNGGLVVAGDNHSCGRACDVSTLARFLTEAELGLDLFINGICAPPLNLQGPSRDTPHECRFPSRGNRRRCMH